MKLVLLIGAFAFSTTRGQNYDYYEEYDYDQDQDQVYDLAEDQNQANDYEQEQGQDYNYYEEYDYDQEQDQVYDLAGPNQVNDYEQEQGQVNNLQTMDAVTFDWKSALDIWGSIIEFFVSSNLTCAPTASCKETGGYCFTSGSTCDGKIDAFGCLGGRRCMCCMPHVGKKMCWSEDHQISFDHGFTGFYHCDEYTCDDGIWVATGVKDADCITNNSCYYNGYEYEHGFTVVVAHCEEYLCDNGDWKSTGQDEPYCQGDTSIEDSTTEDYPVHQSKGCLSMNESTYTIFANGEKSFHECDGFVCDNGEWMPTYEIDPFCQDDTTVKTTEDTTKSQSQGRPCWSNVHHTSFDHGVTGFYQCKEYTCVNGNFIPTGVIHTDCDSDSGCYSYVTKDYQTNGVVGFYECKEYVCYKGAWLPTGEDDPHCQNDTTLIGTTPEAPTTPSEKSLPKCEKEDHVQCDPAKHICDFQIVQEHCPEMCGLCSTDMTDITIIKQVRPTLPEGFKYEGNFVIPTKNAELMMWEDSVRKCQDLGAEPYIPKTQQEFQIIKNVFLELVGDDAAYPDALWVPATDVDQEDVLTWWNGEDAHETEGLVWYEDRYLDSNGDDFNCVALGSFQGIIGAWMDDCYYLNWPMICIIKE